MRCSRRLRHGVRLSAGLGPVNLQTNGSLAEQDVDCTMRQGINKLPLWSLKMVVKLSGKSTGVSNDLKKRISELGCIFIHIPKCAGNAVQQSLFGDIVFGHQTVRQYQLGLPRDTYRKAWKFTITRDPWERIVSAWRFLKAGGYHENDSKYFSETLSQYTTFDHFVNDWLVYQDLDQCGCTHFKTQLHYLRNLRGEVAMDSIIKLSDLSDEYPELRNRLGGDELKVHNKTEGEDIDYRKFYNSNETLKNISTIYAEDIQELSYAPNPNLG